MTNLRASGRALALASAAGSLPGVGAILLTGPVSGEAELTLGVAGVVAAFTGAFVAPIVVASRGRRRPGS